jgi:hypothetical protein
MRTAAGVQAKEPAPAFLVLAMEDDIGVAAQAALPVFADHLCSVGE